MGQVLETIDEDLQTFLESQHVFFVGTAPLDADGHVNISPKGGIGSFRVIGPTHVAYRDLTGSGVETISHLRENKRVVLMFCSFSGKPQIVRLHGFGTVLLPESAEWPDLIDRFPEHRGTRAIISVEVTRVSSSCGFAVPTFEQVGERDLLDQWAEKRSDDQINEYQLRRNSESIDGLPGLPLKTPLG
jgi:hypothetical protein